ncbi:MAG: hypothetical protein V1877_00335 [Candidatus Tagabacteria bacterium]
MEIKWKIKCPFFKVCGPAPIHQRLARRAFSCGDPRRDYIAVVCNDEGRYLECEHYKIRAKPKEAEKMKLSMEELVQEKKREIIVLTPYTFYSLTKILRKESLLVKNSWLNIEPSQEEVNYVIAAIEEVADILKMKK